MNIDQNQQVVHIQAPHDVEIAKLGVDLNKTYVAFGASGEQSRARQSAQDSNAVASKQGAEVQRAVSKASVAYDNSRWDLVDACNKAAVKLEDMKEEQLPEEMRKMTPDERKKYVEAKTAERGAIQQKINDLNKARQQYVAEEMKKQADTGKNTLDAALITTVREQCAKKSFEFTEQK